MKDSEVRELLKKGWIRGIVTFEVAGKPQEHVVKSLEAYLDNIKKDHKIRIISEDREEPIAHEDGMFSTFAELDMLVENLETFTWLCVNFSPASIEIIEPENVEVEAREMTNWLNDLLSKIHEIGHDYRGQKQTREQLVVAMNQLIQNSILLSLKTGEKTANQIAKDTGVLEAQLTPFIEHLMKKGTVKKEGEVFSLA